MIDRDIVNCIHRLFHSMEFTETEQDDLFWCGRDTSGPLVANGFIVENEAHKFELPTAIMNFVKQVDAQLDNLPSTELMFGFPVSATLHGMGEARQSFLAMPYGPDWFESVRKAATATAHSQGFEIEVTGDLRKPGPILNQVWSGIRKADTVVADITGNNPNVFYEIGLAHALGKEVIFLTQDEGPLPFDIRNQRCIKYSKDDLGTMKTELADAFGSVAYRYPHQDPKRRNHGKPYAAPRVM